MAGPTLAPYVSALVAERIAAAGSAVPGSTWRLDAAVLLVDITGFTTLTERYGRMGPEGAELLSTRIDRDFDRAISMILDSGGDVATFAGDAILAVWPAEIAGPGAAVRAAAGCGLAIQAALGGGAPDEESPIRFRAGVAFGEVVLGLVGSEARVRPIFGGDPFREAGLAAAAGRPGDVVASGGAAAAGDLAGEPGADGTLVLDPGRAPDGIPVAAHAAAGDELLRAVLAPELCSLIATGHGAWLAEFRRASVLFLAIEGVDWAAPDVIERLSVAATQVQGVVERYEGMLTGLVVDDKGTVAIAAWGTPERTHEDDPVRAVEAAMAAVAALAGAGIRTRAGVAAGRLFTGLRGNGRRSEYALFGDEMNIAARLMQFSDDGVRCEATIARAVAGRVALEPLGSFPLKGKVHPVEIFRPVGGAARPARIERAAPALVGREREWQAIDAHLEGLRAGSPIGPVLLSGDPGIGKSSLLARLVATASAAGATVLTGEADPIERATGYFVWRRPLARLLGGEIEDGARLTAALRAAFADDPAALDRASLLDAILPVELPRTARTASLEAEVRADAIRETVVALLRRAAATTPVVLVLDDAHWFDTPSFALASEVARSVPGLLLVVASRPFPDEPPAAWTRLAELDGTLRLDLGALDRDGVASLIRDALEVPVGDDVVELVATRAEGNPFFTEQLALALRESERLVERDGVLVLRPGTAETADETLPSTVQGVITGRIDRLTPQEQLTLKVASVIGRLFRYHVIADVHPVSPGSPRILDDLDRSVRLDLTQLDAPDPERSYLFKHVITQQVAYELLVFAQRRPLHRAVAEWYEAHADDLEPLLPLLAHHWRRAEVPDRALHYLDRAAGQALGNHANAEALRFIEQARTIDEAAGGITEPHVRARWERWAGIALVKLARYPEARAHFEAALTLAGRPDPRGNVRLGGRLAREILLQARRRIGGVRPLPAAERERALELSEIQRYLSEVSYWQNDIPRMAHAMFTSANLAEPAGDSKELVVAFASVQFLIGLLLLGRVERYYQRLVDVAGQRAGNEDAIAYAKELESVGAIVVADWDRAYAAADTGAALFRQVGDVMRWHTCFSLVAYADMHRGRLAEARPRFAEGLDALGPHGHLQGRIWSLAGLAVIALAQDDPDAPAVHALEALLGDGVHFADGILGHGIAALAHVRRGDREGAIGHAREADRRLRGLTPNSWHTLEGISGVAEAWLELWEAAGGGRRGRYRREARRAVGRFSRFALLNPEARPRARRLEGVVRLLDGDADGARSKWADAVRLGVRSRMPGEVALAWLARAASLPPGSDQRTAALGAARVALEGLGQGRAEARLAGLEAEEGTVSPA